MKMGMKKPIQDNNDHFVFAAFLLTFSSIKEYSLSHGAMARLWTLKLKETLEVFVLGVSGSLSCMIHEPLGLN